MVSGAEGLSGAAGRRWRCEREGQLVTRSEFGAMIREWRMRFGKWPGQDVTPTAGVFQRGFEAGLAYARKEAAHDSRHAQSDSRMNAQ
jgi:hypothetical protein